MNSNLENISKALNESLEHVRMPKVRDDDQEKQALQQEKDLVLQMKSEAEELIDTLKFLPTRVSHKTLVR